MASEEIVDLRNFRFIAHKYRCPIRQHRKPVLAGYSGNTSMVKIGQSFPQRSAQHVSESASAKLLRACLPATWLIRELTERDYGIDVLIEIITNGQMAGNMVAGQV